MSHWNHRVVREDDKVFGGYYYTIRETFYNDKGEICAYTEEATGVGGESIEDLRELLGWMLKSLDTPVLIDGEVETVGFAGDIDEDDTGSW